MASRASAPFTWASDPDTVLRFCPSKVTSTWVTARLANRPISTPIISSMRVKPLCDGRAMACLQDGGGQDIGSGPFAGQRPGERDVQRAGSRGDGDRGLA